MGLYMKHFRATPQTHHFQKIMHSFITHQKVNFFTLIRNTKFGLSKYRGYNVKKAFSHTFA